MLDGANWKSLQILYVSTYAREIGKQELESLSRRVQLRNGALGVSGFLRGNGQRFSQLLEGPSEVVLPLMERIVSDSRHCNLHVVVEATTKLRLCDGFQVELYESGADAPFSGINLEQSTIHTALRIYAQRNA